MGNVIESFFSGLAKSIGKLFGYPVDFLSGKSCSTICGSTWDFTCYIENFCFVNLLKMASVLALLYIVLLFLYLLYKVGICECISHSLCRIVRSCFSCWLSALENCCAFFCFKLLQCQRTNRWHRRNYSEEFDSNRLYGDWSLSNRIGHSLSHRMRHHRHPHVRKSLRPRNHRAIVRIRGHSHHKTKPSKHSDDIRVVRTTKFSRKGARHRRVNYKSHRR